MGVPGGGGFGSSGGSSFSQSGGGGGFGSSGGSSFSQSGGGGSFGNDSSSSHHHHHHHHRRDSFSYPYTDPIYPDYRRQPVSGSGGDVKCGKPCSMFGSFFVFCGSVWMMFGLFKSDQIEMGLNYSRIMSANSILVQEIQVRNLRDPGPVIYSFSKSPALSGSVDYSETHDVIVGPNSYKDWAFWLNPGSTIQLLYEVQGFGQDYLVLALIRGREGLENWKLAPNNPTTALKWYRIWGIGIKDFVADRGDEYFIAFGNLNPQDVKVITKFSIHSTLYDVKGADKRTPFTSVVESMTLPLSLFRSNCLSLTTPSEPQDGVDVWEVAVVYTARWVTYYTIWGIAILALVILCFIEERGARFWRRSREELPLLAPESDHAVPTSATNYPPSVAASAPPGEFNGKVLDDSQLCTICLDAPKDCFFDPCGHRCTCYTCGQRIQGEHTGTCPICRQPIRAVRKIFDS